MFTVSIILALLALASVAVIVVAGNEEVRTIAKWVLPGAASLAVGSLVLASMSTVPTRNVGIVKQFNKQTGRTTGAGLQWTAPWQDVDEWDASGQTYAHLGDNCVWVTIAAGRGACIPVQIEWAAKPETAPEMWATYKEVDGKSRFETFVDRRVNPQINAALTSTFASFDPLATVNTKTGEAPAPDLNKLFKVPLIAALNTALGQEITVRSVAFGAPRYDKPTTDNIAAYGHKILESRNLEIDKQNAQIRKQITATDASVDQVARCLQIAEKGGKEPGLCMGGGRPVLTRPVG